MYMLFVHNIRNIVMGDGCNQTVLHRVIQGNRLVCLDVTVWIILSKEVCMNICLVVCGYRNEHWPNRGSGAIVRPIHTYHAVLLRV
jgi:hypothetical protein